MVYNFNEILNGFCENRKIKSIPLYLFNDIKSLNSTRIISEKQKKFLNTSFALDLQHFGFFPDEQFVLGGAIAIVKKSLEPKESLIDQAAKLSQKLPKRKWSVQFVDEFIIKYFKFPIWYLFLRRLLAIIVVIILLFSYFLVMNV